MNQQLFYFLFTVLSTAYLYIGLKAARTVHTVSDYFLADRKLGLFALTIALIATQLGGGVILGTSKEAFSLGLYGLLYVISISIGFLILASGVAGKLRTFNVSTTAELFETEFKAPLLKKVASLLSMFSLCGILLAQMVATRNLMISLGVYSELLFFLFWAFVIVYTMLGGLRAIVNNDIFQLAFIILIFCSLFIYELWLSPSQVISTFSTPITITTGFFTWGRLLAIIIIPACYLLIEQDIAQTLFAARTPKIALIGTFLASLFMLIFALIPVYFGMKAQVLGLQVPEPANPLMFLIDKEYSPLIVTLVVYGIFAAIISTADALLCAISSHVVQDFNLTRYTEQPLLISKVVTLTVGAIALFIGRYFSNIIDILVGSYDIPVTTLFVPLVCCYFMNTRSKLGAYLAIAGGFIGFVLFKPCALCALALPEAVALGLSALGYLIGYFIDRSKNKLIV